MASAADQDDPRHPLRDQVVEAQHAVDAASSIDDLLADAGLEPPTPYTLAHSYDGYSTNVPAADLVGGKAMVATLYEGKPLTPDHGGPARLLVPHLYFWKSAKWINGLQFTEQGRAGLLGAARLSHLRRSLA